MFKTGQKVICVDVTPRAIPPNRFFWGWACEYLKLGEIYVVEAAGICHCDKLVVDVGIRSQSGCECECGQGWGVGIMWQEAFRFHVVEEKSETMVEDVLESIEVQEPERSGVSFFLPMFDR